ncbi:MAG: TIGR03435 family protein [Acidobacteriaceae bacterium]
MRKSAARYAIATKLLVPIVLALLAVPAIAQQPAPTAPQATPPVYDIVSIHPHSTLDDNVSINTRPGNFTASNVSLKQLISFAYGVRDDLISGLPSWANNARFDIVAKVSDFDASAFMHLTREQHEAMLRPMLTDRFKVKLHTEIKTLPVFDLVVTKGGPKFKPSPPPTSDPDNPNKHSSGTWISNQDLTATSITMPNFAETLAGQLDRTVIDKTGLTGVYDLKLKWTPDRLLNQTADDGAADRPPDLLTALQEQLGLKLLSAKGPVKTLVIDHAEKPTPN